MDNKISTGQITMYFSLKDEFGNFILIGEYIRNMKYYLHKIINFLNQIKIMDSFS